MRGIVATLTLVGVLIGALLLLWWYDREPSDAAGVLDGRAVGLQAGVLACDTATVRWPAESTPLGASSSEATATLRWPTWTPIPSNTPRVYPSWTPEPTNTPRVYPSWTPLPSWTPRTTPTATWPMPPTHPPAATSTLSPLPSKPCEAPWPYTYAERQTIAAAARNHLWLGPAGDEPMTLPQEDAILSIGLYLLDLGAPLTTEYAVLAENRAHIRCRGFALGIVAVMEGYPDDTCRNWAVLSWGGETLASERR